VGHGRGINVLQKLALILDYAGIFEAGAVFHPGDVATKQAGSASVQTANKHIPAFAMIALLIATHPVVAILILIENAIFRGQWPFTVPTAACARCCLSNAF